MQTSAEPHAVPSRRLFTVVAIAWIAGIAAIAFAIIMSMRGAPVGNAPPSAVASAPPSAPLPSATATNTPTPEPTVEPEGSVVNGFDAHAIYQECVNATPEITGYDHALAPEEFTAGGVVAGVDAYTEEIVPEAEWSSVATVYVNWPTDSTPTKIIAICTASGSPENPIVSFVRTLS